MRRLLGLKPKERPEVEPQSTSMGSQLNQPVFARFPARYLVSAGGVAIFHVASEQIVICYDPQAGYWFLPKGRRDAGEESMRAAEREGFEEVRAGRLYDCACSLWLTRNQSGYRNRILPVAVNHCQPLAHNPASADAYSPYVTEPVWTELVPQTAKRQYMLHWYIAETLPPELEASLSANGPRPYREPPKYPSTLRLLDRTRAEPKGYIPPKHEGTGVDEEELQYQSFLLPIEEAKNRLKRTSSVMVDVVNVGWQAICDRLRDEAGDDDEAAKPVATEELLSTEATAKEGV